MGIVLTRWTGDAPPTRTRLEHQLAREGLSPGWWSNGPGDVYAAHSHPYHKVLFCAEGGIAFSLGAEDFVLRPGDRLDISPGTTHSAMVGNQGATCVEAAR